jgi:hypothetical protein
MARLLTYPANSTPGAVKPIYQSVCCSYTLCITHAHLPPGDVCSFAAIGVPSLMQGAHLLWARDIRMCWCMSHSCGRFGPMPPETPHPNSTAAFYACFAIDVLAGNVSDVTNAPCLGLILFDHHCTESLYFLFYTRATGMECKVTEGKCH